MKRSLLALAFGAVAAWLLLPKPDLLDGVPFSTVIRDRYGEVLDVTLAADDRYRIFTPIDRISPRLIEATLRHEDRFFSRHPGVNPVSLLRAAWCWAIGPQRGGASTVTMQLARLRYRLNTRTPAGKLRQIGIAVCLERHYSKEEILEAYFNLAPYGGNVEGIGAAAWRYLGRAPDSLSWAEAVSFAVIPQSPARRQPRVAVSNEALDLAHRRLYGHLLEAGVVSDRLGGEFTLIARRSPQNPAPHFTRRFARASGDVRTTLDARLQELVRDCVGEHVSTLASTGVRNASALLVDTDRMEVVAAVGSAGFFDASIDGQVDGTRAKRSPGSALKPFIYALAMDQGLIHPATLLADAPKRFGDYNPENFDREFCGPISASSALVRSRNVPAVDLASRLHGPDLQEFLAAGGVRFGSDPRSYGLSLALGGAEVTMEELAGLYAALANGGVWHPLQTTVQDGSSSARRLLSPEASFLVLDMLADSPRPEGERSDRRVAWKTGTSHGFRDAWAVGVFDHFVLAVWVGNFDGRANPALVGRSCAGPLFFRVIDRLSARGEERREPFVPSAGLNLRKVVLCRVSGDIPGGFCSDRTTCWFIPGVSPIRTCAVHREILVDRESGLRVLRDDGDCRREVFECWPSNLLSLFEQAGLPRRTPPPFRPDCAIENSARMEDAPQIVSPSGAATLVATGEPIPLVASASSGVRRIYWFANQTFLGESRPDACFEWKPEMGEFHVIALDDAGRSSSRKVRVMGAVASNRSKAVVDSLP